MKISEKIRQELNEELEFDKIILGIMSLGVNFKDSIELGKKITSSAFKLDYDRIYLAQCVYNVLAMGKDNLLERIK